jgi:ADP-ribose pyrophosphatase YjhB (NUDIX family)
VIPTKEYKKILASVPVPTVDILIFRSGKFLLVKRKKKPLKGKWWPPGGRVLRGESLDQAVYRKLSEELGLDEIYSREFAGVYEDTYPDNEFGLSYIHTISSVFFVCLTAPLLSEEPKIKLDGQSSAWRWSEQLPERLRIHLTGSRLQEFLIKRRIGR